VAPLFAASAGTWSAARSCAWSGSSGLPGGKVRYVGGGCAAVADLGQG